MIIDCYLKFEGVERFESVPAIVVERCNCGLFRPNIRPMPPLLRSTSWPDSLLDPPPPAPAPPLVPGAVLEAVVVVSVVADRFERALLVGGVAVVEPGSPMSRDRITSLAVILDCLEGGLEYGSDCSSDLERVLSLGGLAETTLDE